MYHQVAQRTGATDEYLLGFSYHTKNTVPAESVLNQDRNRHSPED